MVGKKVKLNTGESKIVLIDADSMLYHAAYGTEDDQITSEMKLVEKIYAILNIVEESYIVEKYYIFIRGENNFRKDIYPIYKANRPQKHDIINTLGKFLAENEQFQAIECHGAEADDCVFSYAEMFKNNCIICSIDKDLLQIPGLHYNYIKNTYTEVSEEDAKYNLAVQMIIGDAGDNINLTPKYGLSYANKVLRKGMSNYQYIKEIYKVFFKCWGSEAKEKCKLAYNLLKLKIMYK